MYEEPARGRHLRRAKVQLSLIYAKKEVKFFSELIFIYLRRLFNTKNFCKMPKMKTNSGAKKRFTLTATGEVKRKHAFKSHILTKKTTKQKRNLTHTGLVDQADATRVKMMLVK